MMKKKIIAMLLVGLIGTQSVYGMQTNTQPQPTMPIPEPAPELITKPTITTKLIPYDKSLTKKAKTIAIDMATAYGALMGVILTHELAHALAAKLLLDAPINVIMGAMNESGNIIAQIGGIKFYSLIPFIGYNDISITNAVHVHPLKRAAVFLAGPFAGMIFSAAVFKFLNKYSGFYITKTALVIPNLAEILVAPFSNLTDFNRARKCIQNYRNS